MAIGCCHIAVKVTALCCQSDSSGVHPSRAHLQMAALAVITCGLLSCFGLGVDSLCQLVQPGIGLLFLLQCDLQGLHPVIAAQQVGIGADGAVCGDFVV